MSYTCFSMLVVIILWEVLDVETKHVGKQWQTKSYYNNSSSSFVLLTRLCLKKKVIDPWSLILDRVILDPFFFQESLSLLEIEALLGSIFWLTVDVSLANQISWTVVTRSMTGLF